MKVIIATDIFGAGEHIEKLCLGLKDSCSSTKVINPYSNNRMGFINEEQAYNFFLKDCGHDYFSSLVSRAISNASEQVYLIGFSAGASAIWHAIGTNKYSTLVKFYGFYPSQIRNYVHLSPSCESTIVFPCSEKHFKVSTVSEEISKNPKVECETTDLYHGFMNPKSKNYNSMAAKEFNKRLKGDVTSVASGEF